MVAAGRWRVPLEAECGHADITSRVQSAIAGAGIRTGIAVVQVIGSTGAVTTIEYEAGALQDLRGAIERLAPVGQRYEHDARWQDGNGFSHVRSALVKTGLALAVRDGRAELGTWQQVVVLNFDNRRRERDVSWTVVGE